MREPFVHIGRPQHSEGFALAAGTVHTVHTPYDFYGTCFSKINVIGNPYHLWRRTT